VNLAAVSLAALFLAIAVSCFSRINVGLLATALAFAIGSGLGGMKPAAVAAGFPVSLFLTLVGISLLFSYAQVNGTLDAVAKRVILAVRGNARLIPVLFFAAALMLAATGVGGISACALLAPVAMSVAAEAAISPFLMAIMVANGSNAGTFSPLAPTGIIASNLMSQAGLMGAEWRNFFHTLGAQSFVAFAGYFALVSRAPSRRIEAAADIVPLNRKQIVTLAIQSGVIASVVFLKADLIVAAFAGVAALAILDPSGEEEAVRVLPWNTILMVCGMMVLIGVLEKTGGMDMFTSLLARLSGPKSVTAVIAFVTGAISVYSSSSGVVLPAFLPAIPGLVARLGGGDPLAIAYSINVGAHLVDVSPLSTLGALCIACAPGDRKRLFNQMMLWGLSMTVVGALVCWLFFGLLRA
jgi:di/tricarboxylate transporter